MFFRREKTVPLKLFMTKSRILPETNANDDLFKNAPPVAKKLLEQSRKLKREQERKEFKERQLEFFDKLHNESR